MTSKAEAVGRQIQVQGVPVEPALVEGLTKLVAQFNDRLMRLEPFRALVQLQAREAEGRPLEALGGKDLVQHLESELAVEPAYGAFKLLKQAFDELGRTPSASSSSIVAAPPVQLATIVQAAPAVPEVVKAGSPIDPDPSLASASAAVAAMFVVTPVAPAGPDVASASLPRNIEAIAQTGVRLPPPAPVATPQSTVFQRRDAAEADVLASLTRLRAPSRATVPEVIAGTSGNPLTDDVAEIRIVAKPISNSSATNADLGASPSSAANGPLPITPAPQRRLPEDSTASDFGEASIEIRGSAPVAKVRLAAPELQSAIPSGRTSAALGRFVRALRRDKN